MPGVISEQPAAKSALIAASDWYATMPDPVLVSGDRNVGHLRIRRYAGTPAEMQQPPLFDNLLCMHLGGAKEVRRWHNRRLDVHTVDLRALTIMPASQSNRWLTKGPIDFAHLELSGPLIARVISEEFDLEPNSIVLGDNVGLRDPYVENIFEALLNAVDARAPKQRLYPDSLLVVLVVTLLQRYSTKAASVVRRSSERATRGGLAPWRLRRTVDYMTANLAVDIGLDDLCAQAELSRAQFFRAFKQSTGLSPHRYLTNLRLDAARSLLSRGECRVEEVATRVGLPKSDWFSSLFHRQFGATPRAYVLGRRR